MIRSSRVHAILPFIALSAASPALAAPTVDPNVIRALDLGTHRANGPRTRAHIRPLASVLIELDAPISQATLTAFEKAGVEMAQRSGRASALARYVAADIDRATLANLVTLPGVTRIVHVPSRGPLPLDHTTALLHLASARGAKQTIDQLTGHGMLVADTDSNADVFHPQFFHGDAGYFDWIDVDGDEQFDIEKDAIDLNADGQASPTEVAHAIMAATYSLYGGEASARDDSFDPGLDWVYLDDNENGKRDYGIDDGFDDSVPGFGEPLFVPDDVDQSGTIDPGERFVRLGTSKFRKVYTSVYVGYMNKIRVYERGVDLTSHVNELTESSWLGSDAVHGTGVMSILLGDVPLVGRRWVGLAPEAEAVLVADLGGSGATGAAWMLDEGPDVALWEMAPWTGLPLDGTDPYSKLVDETAELDEVAHACPAGNTGGSRKHAHVALPAGETTVVPFTNPPGLDATYVEVSLNIRGASDMAVWLIAPDGTEIDVTGNAGSEIPAFPGVVVYPTVQTTERGTYFVDTVLYAYQAPQDELQVGDWQVRIEGDPTKEATLDAYLMDEVSSWGPGVVFPEEVATDVSTIGAPAVADHAIAVGAFTGHPSNPSEPWFYGEEGAGEVREYSGRGPRIDGVERLDIVAPDNPFAAAPFIENYFGQGEIPHGAFWVFGGTSGAGPHVAGVAMLLAQAGIRGDSARQAIRDGAQRDAITTADLRAYGAGRLDAAGALGVVPSGPPSVRITQSPAPGIAGTETALSLVTTDPEHSAASLIARWDDGYDGTWETDYGAVAERMVVHEEPGSYPYKVRVKNPGGRIAEAVIWLEVAEAPPEQPDGGAPDAGGTDAGSTPKPPASEAQGGDSDDGCGCRVPSGRDGSGWFAVMSIAFALASRRRIGVRSGRRS